MSRYSPFAWSYLKGVSALRVLELDYAPITDLNGVEALRSLGVLKLTECRNLADISDLAGLRELRGLRLALCNRVEDHAPIGALTHLQVLTIEAKRLSSLAFLRGLTSLRDLVLRVDRVEDINVDELAHLAGLRRILLPSKRWASTLATTLQARLPTCRVQQ